MPSLKARVVQVTAARILNVGILPVQRDAKLLYAACLQPSEIIPKHPAGKADNCHGRSIEESRPETPSLLLERNDKCTVSKGLLAPAWSAAKLQILRSPSFVIWGRMTP